MSARPAIAMLGSSLVSAYWNGAATYYRGIVRALHDCGFDVTFFEPDAYDRQRHRDIADPHWARIVVYPATLDGVQSAVEQARAADIVIKASGVGVFDEWLEAELALLGGPQRMTVFWDVDAPATLSRMREHPEDPLRRQLHAYDIVLTYGGGRAVVEEYQALGARECVPVYNALDPQTHFPVPAEQRFVGALGFLGNRLPDRERRVREFFLEPAQRLPGLQFVLGGSGWERDVALTPNVRQVGHVYTRDHNAFNASPLAVININRDSMADTGYSPPTRVFEAAGAAACLICDAWPGIEEFLEPDREVLCVAGAQQVTELLLSLTQTRARRIGEAGRRRILSDHTYWHRAVQLAALLSGSGKVRAARRQKGRQAHVG